MSTNIQRFASIMSSRMKQTSTAAVPTTLELGTVQSNMSITTDGLQAVIPRGDYMVNLTLTGGRTTSKVEDHTHDLPDSFRGLQPGDRILVAWCGNEPVVIAIVVGS
jgi:hypothetical protein